MKSAKQIILLICLLIFSLGSSNAQVEVSGTQFMLNKLRLNKGIEGIQITLYEDIKGDPYLFRDFQKGVLSVLNDQKFDVEIRYDLYANQMHLKNKDQIYAIIHPEKVQLIEAGDYKFIYSAYLNSPKDDEPSKSSYFIIKTGGKCTLLVKKNIRIQDAELPTLYQDAKPAKFVPTADTYFLKNDGNSAVQIRNKKDLLTVLADKSDAVKSYISSNKLGVKEIEELTKIITYYNSL
jgi:hypothetical protein